MTRIAAAKLLALASFVKQQPFAPTDAQSMSQFAALTYCQLFVTKAPAQPAAASFADDRNSNIQSCCKEMDAMRLYSQASYDSYRKEFRIIGEHTNKYLQIK